VPLPIAHAAVGASVAALIVPRDDPQRLKKIALGALLGIAPDFDFFFVWILDWGRAWHRGFTHSIMAALVSGALTYFVLASLVRGFKKQPRDLWAYCLAMMSHGFLDAIFSVGAGGVEFFWPFSQSRYRFGFSALLESDLTPHSMLTQSVLEAVIFLPIFASVLWLSGPRRS
jgi:inner membrane protein